MADAPRQQKNKSRKFGRNKKKCERYSMLGIRAKNKKRKAETLRRHHERNQAKAKVQDTKTA